MKLLIGFIFIGLLLVANGCNTSLRPGKFTSLNTADDQCRILSEKRNFNPHRKSRRRPTDASSITHNTRFSPISLKRIPVVTYDLSLPSAAVDDSDGSMPSMIEPEIHETISEPIADAVVSKPTRQAYPETVASPQVIPSQSHPSWWFYGIATSAGLCSMAGIALFNRRSRTLANWSARNPHIARGALAAIHVAAGSAAFAGGHYLTNIGLTSDLYSAYASAGVLGMAAVTYPMKKVNHGFFSDGFLRRKMHDVALGVSSLCLMFYLGQSGKVDIASLTTQSDIKQEVISSSAIDAQQGRPVHEWPMGGKIAIAALVLALAIVVAYGVAILGCSLACNGYGVLSGVVIFGGGALIILAFAALMRRIFKHDKFLAKKKQRQERRAARKAYREAKSALPTN